MFRLPCPGQRGRARPDDIGQCLPLPFPSGIGQEQLADLFFCGQAGEQKVYGVRRERRCLSRDLRGRLGCDLGGRLRWQCRPGGRFWHGCTEQPQSSRQRMTQKNFFIGFTSGSIIAYSSLKIQTGGAYAIQFHPLPFLFPPGVPGGLLSHAPAGAQRRAGGGQLPVLLSGLRAADLARGGVAGSDGPDVSIGPTAEKMAFRRAAGGERVTARGAAGVLQVPSGRENAAPRHELLLLSAGSLSH